MNDINFSPFPSLITERLILRQVTIEDENEFYFLKSDEEVRKYLDTKAKTMNEAREFLYKINDGIVNNEWILWGISQKNTKFMIGTICLWNISKDQSIAEIGYELIPSYQGKGLMQEAVIKVITYGFESMKLHSLVAISDLNNSKSIKLLTRTNFFKTKENDYKVKSSDVVYQLLNPFLEVNAGK